MIEINNLTTNPVDEEFFKKVAEKVLEEENKGGAELSIALVGQGRIKALNKKYLGKNRVTDVLAFAGDGYGLGEIVICLREVKKNAKRFALPSQILQDKTWEGKAFEKELARVLIHGILHLLGYDHEKPEIAEPSLISHPRFARVKETKKMAEKENYYLNLIFK